jgi:Holliday junction resolvase
MIVALPSNTTTGRLEQSLRPKQAIWVAYERTNQPLRMQFINRSDVRFDLLRVVNKLASAEKGSIQGEQIQTILTQKLEALLSEAQKNTTLIHGARIQSMFAHIAASLGECVLIQELDSGDIYYSGDEIISPDYFIATRSGWEALIEVKNHPADPSKPFSVKTDYIEKLNRYAKIFKRTILFSIYWSKSRFWTLISPSQFTINGNRATITFNECLSQNEMSNLGDFYVATLPPLTIRIQTDRSKPRSIDQSGKCSYTIGSFDILSEERILNGKEADIAFFLMLAGDWQSETKLKTDGNKLDSISLVFAPIEATPGNAIPPSVGILSRMMSSLFNLKTTSDRKIRLINFYEGIGRLGVTIPVDYSSKELPLWRLKLVPRNKPSKDR